MTSPRNHTKIRHGRVSSRSSTAFPAADATPAPSEGRDSQLQSKLLNTVRPLWSRNFLSTAILLFVVAAAPLPFGSTNKPAIAFWCICLGIAVVLMSTRDLRAPHLWIIAGLTVIVAGYAFVLHEQLSDHPWIAPFHPIWQKASEVLGIPLTPSASIVRNEPFFALGAPLANLLALLLGLVIGVDKVRARYILLVIAWSGAAYALYGVLSFLIEPTMILWREKRFYLSSVTGTFISRNTAAAYFGSCCVIWLLLLVEKIRRKIPERRIVWRDLIRHFPRFSAMEILPHVGAFLICLIAMFLTISRAGVGLSLLAMIVAFTVFLRRELPPRIGIWIALGGGAVLALGLLQLFGGRVSGRFDSQGLVDEGRIEAWKSTLRIIADHPWFGTGLGTFASSFPPYRSPNISIRAVWDIAHCTPLELASEVGVPLAGLVAIVCGIMLLLLGRGVSSRRKGALVPLAALVIASLALLHSLIDFTLQMPGYTVPFFALFGAGLAQSWRFESLPGRTGMVNETVDVGQAAA